MHVRLLDAKTMTRQHYFRPYASCGPGLFRMTTTRRICFNASVGAVHICFSAGPLEALIIFIPSTFLQLRMDLYTHYLQNRNVELPQVTLYKLPVYQVLKTQDTGCYVRYRGVFYALDSMELPRQWPVILKGDKCSTQREMICSIIVYFMQLQFLKYKVIYIYML